MQSDGRCDGRLQMRLQLFHRANCSFMTSLWAIFSHRRALIINEGSHRIPLISWMNEVFFLMEGSCPAAGAACFRRCSGAGSHLQESGKIKLQCEEKQSEQNEGSRFFYFSDFVFYDCKWGTARFFFWGCRRHFYIPSSELVFFVTRCEVGRDAQREACHQLSLMFATWHIWGHYTGFVFILPWNVSVAH